MEAVRVRAFVCVGGVGRYSGAGCEVGAARDLSVCCQHIGCIAV